MKAKMLYGLERGPRLEENRGEGSPPRLFGHSRSYAQPAHRTLLRLASYSGVTR